VKEISTNQRTGTKGKERRREGTGQQQRNWVKRTGYKRGKQHTPSHPISGTVTEDKWGRECDSTNDDRNRKGYSSGRRTWKNTHEKNEKQKQGPGSSVLGRSQHTEGVSSRGERGHRLLCQQKKNLG